MISDPLERTAAELQAYAVGIAPTAPRSLVMTVVGALDAEPLPRRGWAWIGLPGPVLGVLRVAALTAIIALGVGGALFAGQLASLLREVRIGASPSPPAVIVTSPSPSATPTPTSSPSSSPTPARTPRPTVVTQPTPPVTFETPGASAEASGSPGASEDSGGQNRGPGGSSPGPSSSEGASGPGGGG